MFKLLGTLLACYTLYAAITGEVWAKDGIRGVRVCRLQRRGYFWVVVAIYGGLSLALLTVL